MARHNAQPCANANTNRRVLEQPRYGCRRTVKTQTQREIPQLHIAALPPPPQAPHRQQPIPCRALHHYTLQCSRGLDYKQTLPKPRSRTDLQHAVRAMLSQQGAASARCLVSKLAITANLEECRHPTVDRQQPEIEIENTGTRVSQPIPLVSALQNPINCHA